MDEQLRSFLDSLSEAYWARTTKRLTNEALKLMAAFGFTGGNYADRASEYALDAVSRAFERCMKNAPSRFDLSLGDQRVAAEDRFWSYLRFNCLRPLITGDAEKWKSRSRWPIVPLGEANDYPEEVPEDLENDAELKVLEMLEMADEELGKFISAAHRQLEDHPSRTDINWTELQRELGITRYASDQLRKRLDALRERMLQAEPAPTTTP